MICLECAYVLMRLADLWESQCYGDVFITKVASDGEDEKGDAAYLDVSRELIGSELLKKMIEKMGEPAEK